MVEIVPHINTLIVDVGTAFTKIGHSGDFRPTYCFRTAEFLPPDRVSLQDASCKILEKYMRECLVDSLILIESLDSGFEDAAKILNFLFVNKVCQSILFLKSPLADAFGFGKVSSVVLSCSASMFRVTVVINGKILETSVEKGGSIWMEQTIQGQLAALGDEYQGVLEEIFESDLTRPISLNSILESSEIIEKLRDRCNIDVFQCISPAIISMAEKIAALRTSYCINKKNSANGCIILSGGMFRFDPFFQFVKSQILDKIGLDFGDFVLRDKELNCTFAGASLFGMNTATKTMFITAYDWKNVGTDIFKLKSF